MTLGGTSHVLVELLLNTFWLHLMNVKSIAMADWVVFSSSFLPRERLRACVSQWVYFLFLFLFCRENQLDCDRLGNSNVALDIYPIPFTFRVSNFSTALNIRFPPTIPTDKRSSQERNWAVAASLLSLEPLWPSSPVDKWTDSWSIRKFAIYWILIDLPVKTNVSSCPIQLAGLTRREKGGGGGNGTQWPAVVWLNSSKRKKRSRPTNGKTKQWLMRKYIHIISYYKYYTCV
jgi:hypothetical protein